MTVSLITADRPDANCVECDIAVTQDELVWWDEDEDTLRHAFCESGTPLGVEPIERWENDITEARLYRLGDSVRVALTWTDFVANEWWEVLPDERLARLRFAALIQWAREEANDEPHEYLPDLDSWIESLRLLEAVARESREGN